jgi:hypothetical protein
VLSRPANDKETAHIMAFLVMWAMNSEHQFVIHEKAADLSKGRKNKKMMGIYMAAMIKYILENPDKESDTMAVWLATYTVLCDYIELPANGVRKTKPIKELLSNKSNLKEYL